MSNDLIAKLMTPQFPIKLHEDSFHGYNCDVPGQTVDVTKNELMWMYDTMVSDQREGRAKEEGQYKDVDGEGSATLAGGRAAGKVLAPSSQSQVPPTYPV